MRFVTLGSLFAICFSPVHAQAPETPTPQTLPFSESPFSVLPPDWVAPLESQGVEALSMMSGNDLDALSERDNTELLVGLYLRALAIGYAMGHKATEQEWLHADFQRVGGVCGDPLTSTCVYEWREKHLAQLPEKDGE